MAGIEHALSRERQLAGTMRDSRFKLTPMDESNRNHYPFPSPRDVDITDRLTGRQMRFIREYADRQHGTDAAIAAGYAPRSAASTASTLLASPIVRDELSRVMHERTAAAFEVSERDIVQQIARMAFVDPRTFFDEDGNALAIKDLPAEAAAALAGWETTESFIDNRRITTSKVKIADRSAALDKLMRWRGMYERDNSQAAGAVGEMLAAIHANGGSRILPGGSST